MKVLVAGASGVVGRRMVPQLVAAGHHVVARSGPDRGRAGGPAGTDLVAVDVFDGEALTALVVAHRPDVVVHQLTRLPRSLAGVDGRSFSDANVRIRTLGTANLVAAATAAGTPRLVAQSLAFAYAPVGPMVVSEEAPLFLDAPGSWGTSVAAVAELEHLVLRRFEGTGTVLRYGRLHGPGTWWAADGDLTAEVRAGTFPLVGDGAGVTSFLHVDDAATAACLAVEAGRPGVYNVADDDPAPSATWIPHLAIRLGAPPPPWLDEQEALSRLGWQAVHERTAQRGAHNGAAREQLGFVPSAPWRDRLGAGPDGPTVRPGPSRAPRGRGAN